MRSLKVCVQQFRIIGRIMSKTDKRRRPTQDRSRSRVDAILNATAEIVSQKGTGGLKIHDLAEYAGVTPSSIYQYFPNKKAIIAALNERYVDATTEMVRESLKDIQSLEEGVDALSVMLDDYYEWYKQQSVISDIWYGMAADKVVHEMDLTNSLDSANVVIEALSPYVDDANKAKLENIAILLTHLTGATIRLCLTRDKESGEQLFSTFKQIIQHSAIVLLSSQTG